METKTLPRGFREEVMKLQRLKLPTDGIKEITEKLNTGLSNMEKSVIELETILKLAIIKIEKYNMEIDKQLKIN